jgi:hypothetical protein
MTFAIRLSDNVKLEEVAYWCPSILDLFGLWGAMASFAASLSLGFIAMAYNRWSFQRHFRNVTKHKRQEAQRLTMSAMEFVRKDENNNTTRNRRDIYQSLQAQYDALLVEPDLRLFETHHFDDEGRVALSAAELKFPSTVFGELRRIAILEHGKKKRAAKFLSIWYGRHLVRKGYITDPQRRFELFAPADGKHITATKSDTVGENHDDDLKRLHRLSSFSSLLRRRRKKSGSQSSRNSLEQDLETRCGSDNDDTTSVKKTNQKDASSGLAIPSGAHDEKVGEGRFADDNLLIDCEKQEKARKVIDEMDPLRLH